MQVDDALLGKLEKLSMIKIDSDKKENFKAELSQIIAKMESLQEVDTSKVSEISSQKTPMREDIPHASNITQSVLQHAPDTQDNYFIVPKIIN